jgi:hypothetical protein
MEQQKQNRGILHFAQDDDLKSFADYDEFKLCRLRRLKLLEI